MSENLNAIKIQYPLLFKENYLAQHFQQMTGANLELFWTNFEKTSNALKTHYFQRKGNNKEISAMIKRNEMLDPLFGIKLVVQDFKDGACMWGQQGWFQRFRHIVYLLIPNA